MKIRNYLTLMIVITILGCVTACTSRGNQLSIQVQQAQVIRGDLTTIVIGSGITAIVTDAKLSFGSGAKLTTLNVKEGDRVTQGEVLAKLDTTGFEVTLAQAKLALAQAQLGQSQAQAGVNQAQLSQVQAKSSLTAALFALDAVQVVSDIKDDMTAVQNQIDTTHANLAIANAQGDSASANALNQNLTSYNMQLLQDENKLNNLLSKPQYTNNKTSSGTSLQDYYLYIGGQQYDRLMVEDARMKELAVEAAQKAVDQAKNGITVAQKTLDQSDDAITLAQKNVDYAQKQINDATLITPFDGIVAALYNHQGDVIPSPAAAPQIVMYLIDPNSLEVQLNVYANDLLIRPIESKSGYQLRYTTRNSIRRSSDVYK